MARLLAAGLAEFDERGFQAVSVDDIVRRAKASHGTFYLYFANKDDFFRVLSGEALSAIDNITGAFPIVTRNGAGRAALRTWVGAFCDAYEQHAAVIKLLSQADVVGRGTWETGLKLLFRLADAISFGMTTGMAEREEGGVGVAARNAQLNAIACLMMLERMNYLLSAEVPLSKTQVIDRLTAIIIAAFHPGAGALT